MDEAAFEAALDRRVQSRLASDRDYLFAENAEQQALAERKIELQEERSLLSSVLYGPPLRDDVRRARLAERIEQISDELVDVIEDMVDAS